MLYLLENVNGGGLKRYTDDLKKIYTIENIVNKIDLYKVNSNDTLLLQNLFFTDIEIEDILYIDNIIITIHDFYWLHEFIMKKFYQDEYPPVHTNYLRNNIVIYPLIYTLLKKAKLIIHSTQFTFNEYSKYFDTNNFKIINHIDYKINDNIYIPKVYNEINIGIFHSLTKYKGEELINYLKNKFTKYNNYKINFLITNIDFKYTENDNIHDIITKYNIHATCLLNIWGETYCYTLTKILNSGLPFLYNNIGSFKYRILNKGIICFENENIDYNILEEKFKVLLDYIIENNDINIYNDKFELINYYEKIIL